jgi:hypothetical protein
MERCKEFEGEVSSIREDLMEVMDGDEWVVRMVDSPMVHDYAVGKTDQPVIIMFRSGLPVIYDGLSEHGSSEVRSASTINGVCFCLSRLSLIFYQYRIILQVLNCSWVW